MSFVRLKCQLKVLVDNILCRDTPLAGIEKGRKTCAGEITFLYNEV